MNQLNLTDILFYLISFWVFGAIVGALFMWAVFKLRAAVADKLAGRQIENLSWTDEQKTVFVWGACIVAAILAIALPLYFYHVHALNREHEQARMMVEHGYTYMPTRLAGWSRADEEVKAFQRNGNRTDWRPCEAMKVQNKLSRKASGDARSSTHD